MWVGFEEVKVKTKTKVWDAYTAREKVQDGTGYAELGQVRWYSWWRRYCFFPKSATLYDAACLKEIAGFCERETIKHRQNRLRR